MNAELRLPNKIEVKLIQSIMANPVLRNRVLVRNNLTPKFEDLPKTEYICPDCQNYADLPVWDEELEDLAFDSDVDLDEIEEGIYYCHRCDRRMLRTETGDY